MFGNDLRCQHGRDRIIHVVSWQDSGGERDAVLLQAAVYRESAAASADDKHLRLPPRCLQFWKAKGFIIGTGGDSIQFGNIAAGENLFRRTVAVYRVVPTQRM